MGLTEQQVRYFETFGFIKLPGLFADEAGTIIDRFEAIWVAHGGGHDWKSHDYQQRSLLLQFIDQDEYLSALLDDPRIEGTIASLLGDDFNYTGGSGNYYVGDTRWHSDIYTAPKYTSVKLAFYLDPLTKDTGCLRFIPGSHHYGDSFADALQPDAQQRQLWGVAGPDIPAVAIETQPGDVVIFNQGTKHASFGGSERRRMMTMNFEQRYAEEDLPALREKDRRNGPALGRHELRRGHGPHCRTRTHATPGTAHGQRRPPRGADRQGPRGDAGVRPGIEGRPIRRGILGRLKRAPDSGPLITKCQWRQRPSRGYPHPGLQGRL